MKETRPMHRIILAFVFCFMMAQAAQAQFTPGGGASNDLLSVLNTLSQVKSPADVTAAANTLGDKLSGLNVPGGINGLGGLMPGDTSTGAPDLASFGNILTSAQNGDLVNAMNGVYTELTNRYNTPGLDPAAKQEIYNQLSQLQGLMQSQSALNAGLTLAQNNVTNLLNSAGLGNAVSALGSLLNGTGDPESIAQTLANTDFAALNAALNKLGMPGVPELSHFLPPGVDPAALGQVLDGFKSGGIDGMLGALQNTLKEKLKNAMPKDIPGLNDLIDQIGNLRNNPGAIGDFLGGLLNNSGMGGFGASADCQMNPAEQVLSQMSASQGDLTKSPGLRICQ